MADVGSAGFPRTTCLPMASPPNLSQPISGAALPRPDIFVGRQPILDRKLNVYAYELLYRSAQQHNPAMAGVNGDQATSSTIINSFMEIGLDRLVRDKYAAINLTESFFLEEDKLPFTPKQVILEILEDIPVTEKLVAAVTRLAGEEESLFERFQSLDYIGMMGITGAGVQGNFSHICNGANLAYEKKLFYEVGGFKDIDHVASGDDMLLMQKVARFYPKSLGFLKNSEATVLTKAKPTIKDFLSQRMRWANAGLERGGAVNDGYEKNPALDASAVLNPE